MPPGTSFDLDVRGGLGEPVCELAVDGSGATLDGCRYTAGGRGTDRVLVSDPVGDTTVVTTYQVDPDAGLDLHGTTWMLPLGGWLEPRADGGSGHLEVRLTGGDAVTLDADGFVHAVAPGRATLQIRDPFTGQQAEVVVHVSPPYIPDDTVDGTNGLTGVATGGFDLNGDGYGDVVFGLQEANLGAAGSGGVQVYLGGPDGLDDQAQVLGEDLSADAEGGRAVHVADLDGDGVLDLLWTAEGASVGARLSGAAYLHRGRGDGTFEPTPWRRFVGERAFDRFGSGAAACDLDGDGWQDVVVSAYAAEDRTADRYANAQGALYAWRGGPEGFDEEPTAIRYGVVPDGEGGWQGQPSGYMGRSLAVGDIDADGRCDVVTGYEAATLGRNRDGVFWVWRGVEGGLLSATPAALVTGDEGAPRTYLGRSLALGDVDGDGADDLVFGAWLLDDLDLGGVAAWSGADVAAADGAVLSMDDAAWRIEGRTRYGYLGVSIVLDDLNQDGVLDVIVGGPRDDDPDGARRAGTAWWISGTRLRPLPAGAQRTIDEVGEVLTVGLPDGYLGQAVAAAGDVDGDGDRDAFVFAGRDSAYGIGAGAVYTVDAGGERRGPYAVPTAPSGHGFGVSLLGMDVTGDGLEDLVMGAPGYGIEELGANAGGLFAHAAAGDGFARRALTLEVDFETRSANDQLGGALAASDLDGDGWSDLLVAAELDSKPTNYSADVVDRFACGGFRSQAGVVYGLRGGRRSVSGTPAWVAHGPLPNGRIRRMVGGFDHDGDGFEDLAAASDVHGGSAGWFGLAHGGPADGSGTVNLCFDTVWTGPERAGTLGSALAPLGDLDGDGCDEIAIGARAEDLGTTNQGVVRVLWGGGPACGSEPAVSTFVGGALVAQAGYALAGGGDVDGDGIGDLAVGAPFLLAGGASVGAAWLVPGSHLLAARRQPLVDGALPPVDLELVEDLLSGAPGLALVGDDPSGLFGGSVALVPDPDDPSRSAVAVGVASGDVGSGLFAGGVVVHTYDPGREALRQAPRIVVAAEGEGIGAMGQAVVVGGGPGRWRLFVGAPTSDLGGPDLGAAYAFPLETR